MRLKKKKRVQTSFFIRRIIRLGIAAVLLLASAAFVYVAYLMRDLPSVDDIGTYQAAQSTKIYDRAGEVLLYEIYGEEKRTVIPFEEIPQYLKDATIAVEDDNFYNHPAFDWRSTMRALFVDIVYGRRIGGSTITQQLAKNIFFTPEKTLSRKVREIIVAFRLERTYSKNEILSLYLNQIPYGANAYGVEAASQSYFNKPASELTLGESALLAALPKAPSYYSPWGLHRKELFARRDFILQRMEELGYIDEQERLHAEQVEIEFAEQTTTISAPHFVIIVQEYLTETYGEDFLRRSGLRVKTTLDVKLQTAAEEAVLRGAEINKELYNGYNAALVAQDTTTGQILALIGSKDYFGDLEPEECIPGSTCKFEGNFNVATQGPRQPGSAMKPLAYVTAFAKGYTPQSIVFDVPTEFTANNPNCPLVVDFTNENDECFHPQNYTGTFLGPITLRNALAQSVNIPAVKTLYLAGIDNTLQTAHAFGISTLNERSRYGLSLVLGGGEVTLIDLVGAYSVFAENGIYHPQTIILEVVDANGKVLENYSDVSDRVIDQQYASMINDVLSDAVARTPVFGAGRVLMVPGHEVAVKTGTTNDYRDAWTIGYTPSLVAGVWAGNNDNSSMEKGAGVFAAAPIWNSFMTAALADRSPETFTRPDQIITDKPILNGDYLAGLQVHTILFYIDKNNPRGSIPQNPQQDSQFMNWEEPVLLWASEHVPNFETYNQDVDIQNLFSASVTQRPTITIQLPMSGDFISDRISVRSLIASSLDIVRVETYLNGNRVDQQTGNFGTEYNYNFVFLPLDVSLQNTLTIRAWDSLNNIGEAEVIVYR